MNTLGYGFLVGVLSILLYKSNIIDLIKRISQSDAPTKENFTLLEINLTEAEGNFDRIGKDLVNTFETIGFAVIYGVHDFDGEELFKWTKWFFDLPLEQKMKISKVAFNPKSPSIFRGYYPIVPGTHSFKEAYEMGIFNREHVTREMPNAAELRNTTTDKNGRLYMRNILEEKNVFPITDNEADDVLFMNTMKKYYKIYHRVARTLLRLMAVGLGFKLNDFDYLFGEKTLSTFRLLHYPSRLDNPSSIPEDASDGNKVLVTGAHFDYTLTILATFNYTGLQIRPPGYSDWIDLPVDKNRLIINFGALLSFMVEGRMIATDHRVLDIGTDRYSVPFFYEPCYDADLSKTYYGSPNHFVGEYMKYGTWMTNRTSQFYEYAKTDFGVAD